MKFYLSTANENLNLEFLRYKKCNLVDEKDLKNQNIREVILISIDKPRLIDLTKPFYKKILFRLEYLPVRKFPFDIYLYMFFFDFIFEWDSFLLNNSFSFLPFFPPRIGMIHENEIVKEKIEINYFINSYFKKSNLISTVMSDKKNLLWQKTRINLIDFLEIEDIKIKRFGRGTNMINDKSEALIPFKYHIAIENCSNGPSEKLWDPLLCNCVVFYGGNLELIHPNIRKAIIQIPIFNKKKSKEIICKEIQESKVLNSINEKEWKEIKLTIKKFYSFENQFIFRDNYSFKN